MKKRCGVTQYSSSNQHKRLAVCEEAARIMDQQGIRDFQMAKTKAAQRLGLGSRFPLPSNREIEEILRQRLRLFNAEYQADRGSTLWCAAAAIMAAFSRYEPRLVGALLRGVVTEKTPVELHLFADTPEEIVGSFELHAMPYEIFEKRVRFRRKRYTFIQAFRFARGDVGVEVLVFGRKDIREAPLCPVDGQPMQRIALRRVREIQASGSPAGTSHQVVM